MEYFAILYFRFSTCTIKKKLLKNCFYFCNVILKEFLHKPSTSHSFSYLMNMYLFASFIVDDPLLDICISLRFIERQMVKFYLGK